MKETALVITTMGDGEILESICKSSVQSDIMDKMTLIIIPDRKSPMKLFDKCEEIRNYGFKILYPIVTEQDNFLKKLGFVPELIPYDSDNRRNVGYLMALNCGSEVIISLDDDNYPTQSLEDHLIVGDEVEGRILYSDIQWINICDLLRMDKDHKIYPRGFPYYKRHQSYEINVKWGTGRVGLNLGLWIGDPDLDAITWLATPVKSTSFKGESFLLGEKMRTPINSQNTAVHRDVMPSYYQIRMGAGIKRFDDIFSGYFCQKCMEHMADRIRIGTPIVNHRRNKHNYLMDLQGEIKGILIMEELLPWLEEVKLIGNTYAETYLCLADKLGIQISHFGGSIWTKEIKRYFIDVTIFMREWVKVCQRIG